MEKIKQAVERAKASAIGEQLHPMSADDPLAQSTVIASQGTGPKSGSVFSKPGRALSQNEVRLNWSHLEQHRIVGQNVADPRSKVFDVLRTQVLQAMDQKNWKFLAVTSPTEGCGKTVTAINLALSIARQPERSALLVDMDLQRPAVADYLGIKCRQGVQDILERRAALTDLIVRANADICELLVLPATAPTMHSSELIASRNLDAMLHDIKEYFGSCIVIVDMPPLLQGDEVLATLPRIDAVLLVTAVGVSTLHEIKECNKHLQTTEVLRVVLNKSHEATRRHYY
jgi:Mrp family chromosome partitioning ATPase